ncbi:MULTISPECIES: AAA family ATPase [Psychrilyobacter]|uniref:SMC family ATPase n=1 Tax=Psychrilyobacter piezotolerans TaxID=2293438 RepID=A0ABX9KFS3_9FUSO|nr:MULTISPECIES: SMC family ATPase [Psychrilyobacter]MCS5420982.1 SMC family ATPase [Psychrilyobacter sp. S5]NDI78783.1 SMC family ATPase [Psychrilyobacter piezotolerans]RDE60883.1 SMC family ATPase [Psychrilyobacter sp. S5]REI40672.1 SMC family ATPase [Psychrilyobacter piezotolerans]
MRPIRLKMMGIGPYASEINLDFSKLNEEGLFLITGATGAGKTSIFDGITYALFGRANFDDNEKKNGIICDYIDDNEKSKAYAEYTFDLDGIEYRVKRTPPYEYINRNGKPSKKSECVEIEFKDEIKTNKKEVDKFIEEDIIKLDYKQFKKIIMLAQGSFSEFIQANSNQKSEILKQIFNTDIYEKVSYKLKDRVDMIRKNIYKNKGDIFAGLRTLEIEDEEWKNLLEGEILDYEKLNLIIRSSKLSLETAIREKQNKKSKLDIVTLTKEIEKSKAINEGIKKLHSAENDLLTLQKQDKDIESKKNQIKINQEAMKINGEYETLLASQKNLDEKQKEFFRNKNSLIDAQNISKEKFVNYDKFKRELEETSELISKMSVLEEDLKVFIFHEKEMVNLNKEIKKLTRRLRDTKRSIKHLNSQKCYFEHIESTLKKELEESKKINDHRGLLEKKQLILTPVLANLDNIISIETKIELQQKDIDKLIELTQKKLDIYSDLSHRWFENEAYNLSKELEPGKPCMVCGSTTHPSLPKKPSNSPTKEELNKNKDKYEICKEKLNLCEGNLFSLKNQLECENNKFLESIALNNLPEDRVSLLNLKGEYQDKISDLNTKLETLPTQADLDEAAQNKNENNDKIIQAVAKESEISTNLEVSQSQLKGFIEANFNIKNKFEKRKLNIKDFDETLSSTINRHNKLEDLIKEIEDLKEQIKTQEIQLDSSKKNIEDLEEDLKTKQKKWNESLKDHNFIDIDEYCSIINLPVDSITNEIQVYKDKTIAFKTIISESEKFKNLDLIDLEELNEKSKLITQEINELDKFINREQTKLNSFINPEKKLEDSRKILGDKGKQYKTFNKLYEISVGKYGEKRNNITFQNYVLAVYFQDVLDRANDRLSIMTNNQYHMRLDTGKKGNAGSGLEVNIFDSHTGKERSIKTLSGGETFKASMALALGLSDVVQSQNGGVKLDSVFIDEGFGTLDEESLSVAMDILMELKSSGRTVGIISHVSELKQTITSQIKVEKTVRGSKAEVIY